MRRALGKGLTQLLGEQGDAGPNSVAIDSIRPNSRQPRRHFNDEALEELAQSIREVGILLPLIVRPVADGEYELIAGERRWRAARIAGLDEVPVIIRPASAQDSLEMALIENVQREDISAIECAIAFKQLTGEFGLSQDDVAQKVGKSRVAIANTLRLLKLPEAVQKAITTGDITEGHARALLMVENDGTLIALFHRIVDEGLTVREVERLARGTGGDQPSHNGQSTTERAPKAEKDANLAALEEQMSHLFGTPVSINPAEEGGRIVVPYYSDEDLQRILDLLGIEL